MKKILWFASVLSLSTVAYANQKVFKEVADEAQVGNGEAEVGTYDKKLDKKAIIAQGLAEMKADYWDNCGPWKTIKDRRPAIKKIEELESMQDETKVVENLKDLYKSGEIVAMVGAISNNEIECSLSWFQIYGKDGTVLKIHYNMGD